MTDRLRTELQQNKPFSSVAEEAILNVERTADCFRRELQHVLKPFGITGTQYNALRILRGAMPSGMTCSQLGQRLVSSDPDITRLLDRLVRQGLVSKRRGSKDKRVVLSEISPAGLALLKTLVPVVDEAVKESLAHMPEQQLRRLIDLLEDARTPFIGAHDDSGQSGQRGC